MSKLTSVRIKYDNDQLSNEIPITIQPENIQLENNKTLKSFLEEDYVSTINNLNTKIDNKKIDKNLTKSNYAADAKATGEKINAAKAELKSLIAKLPFTTVTQKQDMTDSSKIYRLIEEGNGEGKLYFYSGYQWKQLVTSVPLGIKDTEVTDNYTLKIYYTDDTVYESKPINVGQKGIGITEIQVDKENSQLVFYFDGPVIIGQDQEGHLIYDDTASFQIAQGPPGPHGRGISNIVMDENNHLIISYDDGSTPYQSPSLEGTGIADANINNQDYLVLTFTDGSEHTIAKSIRGPQGIGISDVSINNSDYLVLTFTDGSTHTVAKSIRGPQGIGISDVDIDENDCLKVTYTNNSTYTIQNKPLKGADGKGISQAKLNENDCLFIKYTDGTQYTSTQSLKGDPIHLYDQTAEILSGDNLNTYKTVGCYQVPANVASTLDNAPCKDAFVLYVSPIRTLNPQILSQSAITQENQVYTRIYKKSDNSWSKWNKIGENNKLKTLSVTKTELEAFYVSNGTSFHPNGLLTIDEAPRFIKKNQIITFEFDKASGSFGGAVLGKGFFLCSDKTEYEHVYTLVDGVQSTKNNDKGKWYRFTEAAYNSNTFPVSKPYRGAWIEILQTWVYIRYCNASNNVIKLTTANAGHNLNLKAATHIKITVQKQGKNIYHIKIETNLGSFSTVFTNGPSEWNYAPFAYSGGAATNAKLTYSCPDLKSPIWLFGDSYLNYEQGRVLGKLLAKDKFKNICVCAIGGGQAVETAWQDLTGEGLENGCPMKSGVTERNPNGFYPKSLSLDLKRMVNMGYLPKYIIWAVGVNTDFSVRGADEDKDTIYHLEHVLIPFCQENNIELILYKPPAIPKLTYEQQIYHEKLHEKLRQLSNQGYKVIDANGAVRASFGSGTDSHNNAVSDRISWGKTLGYSTLQKPYLEYTETNGVVTITDGVHPSSQGSQIIANVFNDLEFQFVQ